MSLVKTNAFSFPVMMLLIGMSTIFTIYIGGSEYIAHSNNPLIADADKLTKGNILEFVIYVNMLTWPVTAIGWVTSIIQRAAASQTRINEFLNTKPTIDNPTSDKLDLKGSIEFKNVTFKYPERDALVLENFSYKI